MSEGQDFFSKPSLPNPSLPILPIVPNIGDLEIRGDPPKEKQKQPTELSVYSRRAQVPRDKSTIVPQTHCRV